MKALPLTKKQFCEDALDFVKKQQTLDKELEDTLTKIHADLEKENKTLANYVERQKVWVL